LAAIHNLTVRHGILRSTFHDNKTLHPKPFVAEWGPSSALPSVRIISKPNDSQGAIRVQSLLRTAVDLSAEFAVRWLIVRGDLETELYLVSHHIALDGTSMSELSTEFFAMLSHTERPHFGTISDSFAKAHMTEASHTAKEFWLEQSKSVSPITWKPVPQAAQSKNYREIETWFNFSKDELAGWSTRYRTSWFRVAVVVVGLLVRMCAEPTCQDHAITVAFSGRPDDMSRSIGHFANALPLRIPLTQVLCSQKPTFDALLRLVSAAVSTAKKHERFSFLDLSHANHVSGLQTPRSQVAITLSPQLSRPECSLYPVEGPYDLFFCFLEAKDSVSLGVIYDPLLFTAATVAGLKTEFRDLLNVVMGETVLQLSSLPSLMIQIPRLPPSLDVTDTSHIDATRFHSMFEYQAAQSPAAMALYSAELHKSCTYRDLSERSNQIAYHLRKSGIGRHKVVLLHLERGFALMEWIIGVLKSGAAYAIADQSHPLERTRNVISIARPDIIVDDGNGQDVVELAGASIQVVDLRTIKLGEISWNNLDDITEPDDLAYIVFTSGSTGQPKGIDIEHRNLSHFIASSHSSGYFRVGPGSRVLQFATFAFDAAVLEWSLCLALGGTLCFAESPYALVGDYLADVIDANKITHMHLTPSVLATLPTSRSVPSLSRISVGGEMVPDSLIETWRVRVDVQNAYGPTECTVVMAHQPHPSGINDEQPAAAIIGKPHAHMEFYTCNETFDRVLPVNEIGEICIAGPQVGRGYRGREDLTATRFMIHPKLGKRLYRTGDRGKILPDGSVFLLGRLDREVKIRGYRIDLDDLERTILDLMPNVNGVSAQADPSGTSLCTFISPETVDVGELKQRLSARVPPYMVPKAVYCLRRLPLNTNDKTDHKMIQKNMNELIAKAKSDQSVRLGTSSPESGFYTPTSPPSSASIGRIESEVSAIWKSVLNVEDSPSTSVNFFDAGGNSLTLTHLHRGMRKKWPDANINLVDLFSHSTIQSQAKVVMASNRSEVATATAPKPSIESSAAICTDIAVVGVAGRFPGASSPDDFYQLLLDRKEAMSFFRDMPADAMIFPGGKYVPVRGSLPDVQHFDWASWGIKEEEAMDIDPQQRLFMTVAKEALQDANCSPASSNNIGTYVGAASGTWHSTREPGYGDDFHRAHHEVLTPSISARTAYHLNLQGPNVTLNTACSSGMVAMSLAIDHLRSNKCEVAVAGGVSITFPQAGYITAERQIFSYSGHCRPFDHRADGTVPADAVCVLVLRRLDDAVAAGDEIYSVISGIATGSDGNVGKAGPTVPSPRGQAETIRRAWEDAGIPANKLVYAELHGSGTPIGDALELEGMNLARTELGVGKIDYTAGSNKGNIGNCEAASGLVSVIKLCKSIQHGFVPPLQSFEAINPLINSGLPVKIAAEGVPLSPEAVVSVSSTGLGGVNAHCIMRFPPTTRRRRPERANIPAAAPSVVSIVVPPVPAPVTPTGGKILTTIVELASDILDIRIEESSNLRDAGLDSRGQIMLMHKLHETFPGCHISYVLLIVLLIPNCANTNNSGSRL
ncbi:amino acid adenylation domain protein, partial [Mycena pura]